jgi:hypothetical protein
MVFPMKKMNKQDIFFLKNFNFYNKKINFEQLKQTEPKVFLVEKTKSAESTIDSDNPDLTRLMNTLEETREFNNIILKNLGIGVMTCLYIIGQINPAY